MLGLTFVIPLIFSCRMIKKIISVVTNWRDFCLRLGFIIFNHYYIPVTVVGFIGIDGRLLSTSLDEYKS